MLEMLSLAVLERPRILLYKPDSVILRGSRVTLVPAVAEADALALFENSNGSVVTLGELTAEPYDAEEKIWRFLFEGPYNDVDSFTNGLVKWIEAPNGLCFTVVHNESGRQIGVVNYMRNHPEHLRIEIGGIWYTPAVQRTGVNTESVFLLLKHAFGLGYRRIEWKCHSEHIRSRNAALRLGFTFEGIQEAHMIWKGSSRDTAWFRMLDSEWPEAKSRLESMLESSA
ncbi:MAG: GNAT family N-acetyltransferase [Armatimonadota bacterium]|nr:GNAT family N-acetyltransferase [Armatimonadota bacterium]